MGADAASDDNWRRRPQSRHEVTGERLCRQEDRSQAQQNVGVEYLLPGAYFDELGEAAARRPNALALRGAGRSAATASTPSLYVRLVSLIQLAFSYNHAGC
jgi:hypothetical protein